MAEKKPDLSWMIHELYREDPGIVELVKESGFSEITSPLMLSTAGHVMTIPKEANMLGIRLEIVLDLFRRRGYSIASLPKEP